MNGLTPAHVLTVYCLVIKMDDHWEPEEPEYEEGLPEYRLMIARCEFCLNSIWSDEEYFEDDDGFTCKGCFEDD